MGLSLQLPFLPLKVSAKSRNTENVCMSRLLKHMDFRTEAVMAVWNIKARQTLHFS